MVEKKKKADSAKVVASSRAAPVARGLRRSQEGIVIATSSQKTVKVAVTRLVKHAKYGKFIRRTSKFLCHDEKGVSGVGDVVKIVEGRPVSAFKRWRIDTVVTKAK